MITRLKIDGFKNLQGIDLYFCEFTCIAGPNGSGKSNLFDAIQFLSLTASRTILEAALAIRGDGGKASNPEHIFCHGGEKGKRQMDFFVEMIVPPAAQDDLNQTARATFTFLTYELSIAERATPGTNMPLEIVKEQLSYHPWTKATKLLHFKNSPLGGPASNKKAKEEAVGTILSPPSKRTMSVSSGAIRMAGVPASPSRLWRKTCPKNREDSLVACARHWTFFHRTFCLFTGTQKRNPGSQRGFEGSFDCSQRIEREKAEEIPLSRASRPSS